MLASARLMLTLLVVTGHGHIAQEGSDPRVQGREFAAAVNLPQQNAKGYGVLFVPKGVERVRGVVLAFDYGNLATQMYYNTELRRAVGNLNCALMFVSVAPMDLPSTPNLPAEGQFLRNAALGGADAVLQLMDRFAAESAHPELKTAPMLLYGFSAAASFVMSFAELHPSRTLGFVRYHIHRRAVPVKMDAIKQVPALIVAGGKDTLAGVEDSQELWQMGRTAGAPWTFAVEPSSQHASPEVFPITVKQLIIPWITAVLGQRLSDSAAIRPIAVSEGWRGDVQTFEAARADTFKGEQVRATWLPDERVATGWQAVVRPPQ